MIYFFVGERKKRKKAIEKKIIENNFPLEKKEFFSPEDFKEKDFYDLIRLNNGLFDEKRIYIIENMAQKIPLRQILSDYQTSDHLIFFSEEKLLKKEELLIKKAGIPIISFSNSLQRKDTEIFQLADYLGQRKKKELWLLWRKLTEKGISAEEIHGVLFWAIKNLILIKHRDTASLNPYLVKKNKNYAKNFTQKELEEKLFKLIKIYHERNSFSSLSVEIEKFILS